LNLKKLSSHGNKESIKISEKADQSARKGLTRYGIFIHFAVMNCRIDTKGAPDWQYGPGVENS
jgi:hypothetical protein